jgi:hypothetical protein
MQLELDAEELPPVAIGNTLHIGPNPAGHRWDGRIVAVKRRPDQVLVLIARGQSSG